MSNEFSDKGLPEQEYFLLRDRVAEALVKRQKFRPSYAKHIAHLALKVVVPYFINREQLNAPANPTEDLGLEKLRHLLDGSPKFQSMGYEVAKPPVGSLTDETFDLLKLGPEELRHLSSALITANIATGNDPVASKKLFTEIVAPGSTKGHIPIKFLGPTIRAMGIDTMPWMPAAGEERGVLKDFLPADLSEWPPVPKHWIPTLAKDPSEVRLSQEDASALADFMQEVKHSGPLYDDHPLQVHLLKPRRAFGGQVHHLSNGSRIHSASQMHKEGLSLHSIWVAPGIMAEGACRLAQIRASDPEDAVRRFADSNEHFRLNFDWITYTFRGTPIYFEEPNLAGVEIREILNNLKPNIMPERHQMAARTVDLVRGEDGELKTASSVQLPDETPRDQPKD